MPADRIFHHLARITVVVGVVLIWWGAAVTTEDVGLAVPDWPLCFGQLNPQGWTGVPALLLEHGHRWLGASIGILVLVLYLWQLITGGTDLGERAEPETRVLESLGIILCGGGYLYLIHQGALAIAFSIAGIGFAWMIITWIYRRWSLLRGLTVLALLLVILQASLGGLRVLQMSDPFGIVHGTLGQAFFCVLLWIALASSRLWERQQVTLGGFQRLTARLGSALLFLAVFGQLILGAILRHTQRVYLAATDIVTTGGKFYPGTEHRDLLTLFLHKYWGACVAVLVIIVAWRAMTWFSAAPSLARVARVLLVLPLLQVGLGIAVILTSKPLRMLNDSAAGGGEAAAGSILHGKSFWLTNFHVVNGLALLALSFLIAVAIWSSGPRPPRNADDGETPEVPADREGDHRLAV